MKEPSLNNWKDRARADAHDLVQTLPRHPGAIRNLYPEFALGDRHTTALDPYLPLWAQLPFFERVIVGITPFLASEEAFHRWYGLSSKSLLRLRAEGRVSLRILFPSALDETPDYLDCFFTDTSIPTTIRDLLFDEHLLTGEVTRELRARFASRWPPAVFSSIDTFEANPARAYTTAQNAYIQLHALGHAQRAIEFEELLTDTTPARALQWLELCRLFLIGPVHYSLLGIHSVAEAAPALTVAKGRPTPVFPSELGRLLADATRLVRHHSVASTFTLQDCLDIYPDFEGARNVLYALQAHLKGDDSDAVISTADELRNLIRSERGTRARFLRVLRFVAVTGATIGSAPLGPAGLLVGLGLAALTELASVQVDRVLMPVVRAARPAYLNLLLHLNEAARTHFRD